MLQGLALVILIFIAFWFGKNFKWAKVSRGKKPFGWWKHKFLCEVGYFLETNFNSNYGRQMYYDNLNIMFRKYNMNLYGEKI